MRDPVLKNEHVPKEILPITTTRGMFLPFLADGLDVEQAVPLQALSGKQVFRPFAQLPSEPAVDRHAEAHLWPLNHCSGNISVQHLSKRPFAFAIANFETHRQSPGKLHYAMVKNRHTRLK